MGEKKEQISSTILIFTYACCIQSTTLIAGFVSNISKQDTWFVVIMGFIFSVPIILLHASLAQKYPGKSIIEINDFVFGNILGKFFSLLYIYYFFAIAFLNTDIMSGFVTTSLLPETPDIAILIFFISVCAYAVRKGVEVFTRYSVLFAMILFIVLIINSSLLIKDMKLSNFQPVLTLPLKDYVHATLNTIFLPFCEIPIYFMFFPNLQDHKSIKKPLFGGLIIGSITMMLVILRNTSVLGPAMGIVSNPSFEAVRLINIANTLTRMEILYAITLLMLIFFKVSIVFYAIVKGIAQIFKLSSYKFIIPIVGALIISATLAAFESSYEHNDWGTNYGVFFEIFFVLVLPLITLIIAAIKGFKKT